AVLPARLDLDEPRVGELGRDSLGRFAERRELDRSGNVALLEARGRELDEARPQLLRALDGHRDGGADQWKWLFRRSKKPSCFAYVSSSLACSNSPSRRRCSSVSFRGSLTFTSTRWSPRPRPCRTGMPRPRSTFVSPGCVPG